MDDWPILILTLPGDDDRRAPLMAQLASMGLSAQLVFGTDGRRGLPAECEALIDRDRARARLGRPMTDGEFACALSHRDIHARILRDDLAGAIVLEDDADLLPEFPALIRSGAHREVPALLFHYRFGRATRLARRDAVPGVTLRRAAMRATSTMAYSVRADAAAMLLRHADPVSFQADWPCDLHDLGAWLSVPRLAQERVEAVSHLQAARMDKVRDGAPPRERRSPRRWLRERLSVRVDRERGHI